ncbi:unnamed protein product [Gongylonema pulchrum]|uniref:Uncharacterized protein n=1 Tax=Gongylonema pulchrum TaxID=637853 RepID=A0A183D1E9_9BILA|nr:unnamed protein product [Gongylonema pulchrum]
MSEKSDQQMVEREAATTTGCGSQITDMARPNKSAKLAKQNGVDEDEGDEASVSTNTVPLAGQLLVAVDRFPGVFSWRLTVNICLSIQESERCVQEEFKSNREEANEATAVFVQQFHCSGTNNSNELLATASEQFDREKLVIPPRKLSMWKAPARSPTLSPSCQKNFTVPARPRLLVRSHAFSGDDDTGASLRHTPTSRLLTSRSTFSSTSFG